MANTIIGGERLLKDAEKFFFVSMQNKKPFEFQYPTGTGNLTFNEPVGTIRSNKGPNGFLEVIEDLPILINVSKKEGPQPRRVYEEIRSNKS